MTVTDTALVRRTLAGGVVVYVSPLLESAGIAHAFTTRMGGASDASGPFGTLNFGSPGDAPAPDMQANIRENYRRTMAGAGLEGEVCTVHQVHGARAVTLRRADAHDDHAKADAIVCDDPRRVLSVRTADCAPVLVATADGTAVAAIHAGWRGVCAGIIRSAVRSLRTLRSGASSHDLLAAVGPSIGVEAFEVGSEVVQALLAAADEGLFGEHPLGETIHLREAPARAHVDIREALRLQLLGEGLRADRIDVSDRCTFRDRSEFFSHRRDRGLTGRMAAFIAPRPARG